MNNRRDFIKKITAAGALVSTGCLALPATSCSAAGSKTDVALNISLQDGLTPGKSLGEKLDYMEKLGVAGMELGGGGLAKRVKEIKDALSGRKVKVSAICAGFGGWILADDPAVKQKCIDSVKEILVAAGELGSTGMVLVPAFNSQHSYPHTQETRDRLVADLKELGEFAHKNKTTVILEPLNRGEAFYLRQVADAASICRDVDSPGVTCMGDFWHMTWEETSDRGAFISAGKYLTHVHIASRKRRLMPGEDGDADNYIDGFKGLKELGYKGYVSFECGTKGNREETVAAAVTLLREQWKQA
ncbi:MAG: sugar phosphate isomerase/epimerase [Prevotellaceae bacterium]|jgi:sugar phosphate isomerase/epimerase|nr:sugar phosphate isomerase/epimerase [Prevotellaceae bacterium]